ncbi:MAG: hypothetical protein Q9208_003338 [Pyrenodesmia sp. 3 TL-2023]
MSDKDTTGNVSAAAASPTPDWSIDTNDWNTSNDKALLRKLDWRLLPALTLLYLLSFLDRSNVANARVEGLVEELHMTGNEYLTGLTLYFVGCVLFEIPCNIILKLTSPRLWLPTLTLAWGVLATLLGVVQNLGGFFAARFVLGITESGLFPSVVFYLSMRIWPYIGMAAAYFFIYNYLATASFLNEQERWRINARLKASGDATRSEAFTWGNVTLALKGPKVWL